MFPCSRNARPQKDRGERPGALLARRAPTMKQWSLDARSKGQPRPLLLSEVCIRSRKVLAAALPAERRVLARRGGWVRSLAFLSILRECPPFVPHLRSVETLPYNVFPQRASNAQEAPSTFETFPICFLLG